MKLHNLLKQTTYFTISTIVLIIFCLFILYTIHFSDSPQKVLEQTAKALEERNTTLFLEQINIRRFATAQVKNFLKGDKTLYTMNDTAKLIHSYQNLDVVAMVQDRQQKERDFFIRTVSDGEIILLCTQQQKSGCPWVPASLQKAIIRNISNTAAVAKVTSPANAISWIALMKKDDKWKIVGQSSNPADASHYAQGKHGYALSTH